MSKGRYLEIPAGADLHGKALKAFADFYLAPSGKVYDAALELHGKGEILGTFVALQCQVDGVGGRRDDRLRWKLNDDLRSRLDARKRHSPVNLYLLAHVKAADVDGVAKLPDDVKLADYEAQQTKLVLDRLERSAAAGFAPACDLLAQKLQAADDLPAAYRWFEKGGELGHGGSLRSQGFLLSGGAGADKDLAKALAVSRRAAAAGDVFAMVNLAHFHHNGLGVEKDPREAQAWIERAARTGHWLGYFERGLALTKGHFGFAIDLKAAEGEFRKGHALRHREVLKLLGQIYAHGVLGNPDGKRAAHFAEAAFVQGHAASAELLAHLHKQGIGGLAKDEKLAQYWAVQAQPNFAFALAAGLAERQQAIEELRSGRLGMAGKQRRQGVEHHQVEGFLAMQGLDAGDQGGPLGVRRTSAMEWATEELQVLLDRELTTTDVPVGRGFPRRRRGPGPATSASRRRVPPGRGGPGGATPASSCPTSAD